MKIQCTVVFVFDSGDQTLEECKEYLKDFPDEALEWMNEADFTFESAEEHEKLADKLTAALQENAK